MTKLGSSTRYSDDGECLDPPLPLSLRILLVRTWVTDRCSGHICGVLRTIWGSDKRLRRRLDPSEEDYARTWS